MKIGIGYDVHQLVPNRKFIIGGIEIEYEKGILGHSDGDVLTHAIINALLGAMGLGDIGQYFPSSDIHYHNILSTNLLKEIKALLDQNQYQIVNIDTIIICQNPKLSPYYQSIKHNLAQVLNMPIADINIKSTTTDNLGVIGQGLGIAAQAITLLAKTI